jgi:phosphoribosylamine--glycine ligase
MGRVLFIERTADGLLDIAIRAQAQGHECRYFLKEYDQHKMPNGRGLVTRAADWRGSMMWADLVILGGNDYAMTEFAAWRAKGVPIIGGTPESAAWESDRALGMAVFKRAGIPAPPFRSFTDYGEAIAYVGRNDRPFVSKPSGKCDDKGLSHVPKSAAGLRWKLNKWRLTGKRPGLEFILQEKISGIETAVGAWFGPGGFAEGWEENFEFKKIGAGDIGINCGEAGTVMRYVKRSKLAEKVLAPLEPQLARLGYVGNVDVNCIVDEDGTPWPLEFTMRCGWPAFNIEQALFAVDPIEFLAGLLADKPPKAAHRYGEVAVGVVLAIGDWPYSRKPQEEVVGVPLWGVDARSVNDIHFAQAMAGEFEGEACYATAGDYVLVATGTAPTVRQARDSAYRTIRRIEAPETPYYRPDIGSRLSREIPQLQELGYVAGLEF